MQSYRILAMDRARGRKLAEAASQLGFRFRPEEVARIQQLLWFGVVTTPALT